jgi:glycosyltransferase involved in cell wall biosynthesis
METELMEFSVVIPCHNYAHFLPDSIGSVLAQRDVTFEVIVVDDGSPDNTAELVKDLGDSRVRCVTTSHMGIGAARNRGIREAVGTYLAFLDADDTWRENRLVRAKERISENPSPTISFTMVQEFLDSALEKSQSNLPQVRLMPGRYASACVVLREVFETVGMFDESLESGEFIDWYIRAQALGVETDVDPDVLVFRRVHQQNRDRRLRESSREYARILMRKMKSSRDTE